MSDRPSMKRRAEKELTRSGSDNDESEFATTPQLASKEEMATRRILRVRRPTTSGANPGTSGLFKGLSTAPASGLDSNTPTSALHSGNSKPVGSLWSAAAPTPGSGFAFSFGAATASAPHAAPGAAPVFPKTFSFTSAVTNFVEARKKVDEAKSGNEKEAEPSPSADKEDGDDTAQLFQGRSVIESSPGEVLACVPSKLYGFEKEEKKWVERGAGDAKLKKEQKSSEKGGEVYRLLVRDGYSLNTVVAKNVFILNTVEAKHLMFTVGSEEGPKNYLLKFVGAQAEQNASKFTEQLKVAMKAVGITETS